MGSHAILTCAGCGKVVRCWDGVCPECGYIHTMPKFGGPTEEDILRCNNKYYKDKLQSAINILKKYEWCIPDSSRRRAGGPRCPVCDNAESVGHTPSCALNELMLVLVK